MQLKVNKISNVESWHKLLDGKITGDGIICLGTVRTVAARVIKEARGTVSGLLDLVPEEILDTELTEENLDWVRQRIKMIQSAKTNDFRQIIGLNNPKNNLSKKKKLRLLKKRLGLPLGYGYLPVKQENKKREIRFLMYLASEVGYQ